MTHCERNSKNNKCTWGGKVLIELHTRRFPCLCTHRTKAYSVQDKDPKSSIYTLLTLYSVGNWTGALRNTDNDTLMQKNMGGAALVAARLSWVRQPKFPQPG